MTEAEWIAFLQRPETPAFNRAMLANPDDDLPRLVFADWMDENCPDAEVNRAVRESVAKPDARPLLAWPDSNRRAKPQLLFYRGRLQASGNRKVPVPADRPPRKLWEAVWRAGWVDSIGFGEITESARAKWACDPLLAMLTQIWFYANESTAETVLAILTSSHLRHLTSLAVNGWWRPIDWLPILIESPIVARLERLNIISVDLRSAAFESLVRSPPLSNLRTLALKDCALNDAGVMALANSPHLGGLKKLELYEDRVSAVGAAALANSRYLCEAIRAQWRCATDGGGANR